MESGIATCTGLSILLVDACRSSACPPASWGRRCGRTNAATTPGLRSGIGAGISWGRLEPDPNGLDRGWFIADAQQARKDVAENAIYATSFAKTDVVFPLPWARRRKPFMP